MPINKRAIGLAVAAGGLVLAVLVGGLGGVAKAQSSQSRSWANGDLTGNWYPSITAFNQNRYDVLSNSVCVGANSNQGDSQVTSVGSGYMAVRSFTNPVINGFDCAYRPMIALELDGLAAWNIQRIDLYMTGTRLNSFEISSSNGTAVQVENYDLSTIDPTQLRTYAASPTLGQLTVPAGGKLYLTLNGAQCQVTQRQVDFNTCPFLYGITITYFPLATAIPPSATTLPATWTPADTATPYPTDYSSPTLPASWTPDTSGYTTTPFSLTGLPTIDYSTLVFETMIPVVTATNMAITIAPVTLTDTCVAFSACGAAFPTLVFPTLNLPTIAPVNTIVVPTLIPTITLTPTAEGTVGPTATGGGATTAPTVGSTATITAGHSIYTTALAAGICITSGFNETHSYDLTNDHYQLFIIVPGMGTVFTAVLGGPFSGAGSFSAFDSVTGYSVPAHTLIQSHWVVTDAGGGLEAIYDRYFDCTTGAAGFPITPTSAATAIPAATATPGSVDLNPVYGFFPTLGALGSNLSPPPSMLTPAAALGAFAGQALGALNIHSTIAPVQTLITIFTIIFAVVVIVNLIQFILPVVLFIFNKVAQIIQMVKPL